MPVQEWVVAAKLKVPIDPRKKIEVLFDDSVVSGILRWSLQAKAKNDGRFSNEHFLELRLALPYERDEQAEIPETYVFEQAMDAVAQIVAQFVLMTARPVSVDGGISVKRSVSPGSLKQRVLLGPAASRSLVPLSDLSSQLLECEIDGSTQRIIRWWSRSASADDDVDRFIALMGALELLAGLQTEVPARTRRCGACGHEQTIGPGVRERVVHFLVANGLELTEAEEIYESRNKVIHGGARFTSQELQRLFHQGVTLFGLIRNAIGEKLQVPLPPNPNVLNIHNRSSHMAFTMEPKD
jgi:hypothetical protein